MIAAPMTSTRLPTPSQIATDPERFAHSFLKIQNKRKELVPLSWNNVQRKLHYSRTGRDLVLKARQMGVSTYIQGELFRRAVTAPRGTLTLSHDSDATAMLREMAERFWAHCTFNGIQPGRSKANAVMTVYSDYDSVAAIATAGNLKAGRGSTFTDIHGSEVAFWTDAEKIVAGALQAGEPDIILESTPNGAQGYFYDLCMEALAGRGVWRLHFFTWWEDPTYRLPLEPGEELTYTDEEKELAAKHGLDAEQINWRRYKKKELKGTFKQEYPEDPVTCFLVSGDSYFGAILENVFTAPAGATYQPGHVYTAGLDFGQSADYTYMPIFDRTANVQVDYLHVNKLPWKEIRRRIKNKYNQWHVSNMLAEVNSIGSVNAEELQADFVDLEIFQTTNESKAALMATYYDYLENGLKLLEWSVQRAEHYNFVSTQLPSGLWRLAAAGEGHDDTVIGNALGIGARQKPLAAKRLGRR
jgi:hypothetical protein